MMYEPKMTSKQSSRKLTESESICPQMCDIHVCSHRLCIPDCMKNQHLNTACRRSNHQAR